MSRTRTTTASILGAMTLLLSACGGADSTQGPELDPAMSEALASRDGVPSIRIVSPAPGATVRQNLTVRVETENVRLAPAGTTHDGEGHWHLLIDQGCLDSGTVIPADEVTVHVGDGTDSVTVELAPGRHELCAQLGDGFHVAVAVTDSIEIDVE